MRNLRQSSDIYFWKFANKLIPNDMIHPHPKDCVSLVPQKAITHS